MSDYSEPFRLLDLIPEIFTNVCEHLEDADLISLRASCRTARDKALHTFGGRFFRVLHCFLHAVSLEVLLEIASHGELSQYVREVSIYLAPVHLKDEAYLEDDRDEAFEREHSTTELSNENLLRADVEDARFQLLSAALAKLGHIRIVFIDAKKPLHIPLQPAVRCGYKYAKVETAKPSPFREESICYYSELESVFQLIDTHLKPHNIAIDMAIHGDIVPESTLQSMNTLEKPAWIQHIAPQLRFLALMVTETNWTFWKDVLSRTSNLVELVIDGWATHFQTVFKPITNDAIYSGPLSQSKLHSVLFQGLHMDEEPTINFLHHHRHTLAEVRIVNCTLQQGSWRPILITIGNLPFLRVIRFHVLVTFEQADGSSTENFKRYDDYMEQSAKWAIYISRAPVPRGRFTQESMHLLDDGILLVMATILQDFRTIRMGSRYHLDLRKANAFAQQLIDWRDGRWMDTPKMQRMDFFRQVEAQRLREEEAEAEDAAEDAVALSASVNSSLMSAGAPLSPGAPTAAMPQPLSIPAHTGNTGPSIPPTDSNTTPQRSVGRAPTRTMTTLSTKKKRREYLLKRLRGLVQIVQARFQ